MKHTVLVGMVAAVVILSVLSVWGKAMILNANIEEKVDAHGKILLPENEGKIVKIMPEIHNSGSVTYDARARMDVIKDNKTLLTLWSGMKRVAPSQRKSFELYFFDYNTTGNYTAHVMLYYGNEIKTLPEINFVMNRMMPEMAFKIYDFRMYEEYMRFDIYSPVQVSDVIIIPVNYSSTWIIKEKKIDELVK